MDSFSLTMINGALKMWPIYAAFVMLYTLITFLKSKRGKGAVGEKVVSTGMWLALDSNIYRRIDDVIIYTSSGTTQIDHIIVSKYGVFVVETKNINGWMFGNAQDDQWTQSIFGNKSRFQNPLKQNYRHIKSLSEFLNIDDSLLHSVVFFIGDCTFKTPMPPNVINSGIVPYIREFKQVILTDEQVGDITARLLSVKQDKAFTHKTHMESIKGRYASKTTCPKCGGQLLKRTAKRGAHAGSSFLGCANYPRCKYVTADE
jgi:hypothetical protein